MTTYVAFLRAINLGRTRKFPKEAIVAATEAAGFTGVATHINTGNVRLETRMRSRARIEAALEAAYEADRGFPVPTIVYTAAELRAIVEDVDRFGGGREEPGGVQYVWLLKDDPDDALAADLEALSVEHERVHVAGRAVHLVLDGANLLESRLTGQVERRLGVATNRNARVLRALVPKWCQAG